jgi:hypothetical protein
LDTNTVKLSGVFFVDSSKVVKDRKHHYIQKQWPKQESLIPGQKNVVSTPLINTEKVHLPLSHIKLGFIKKFGQGNGSKWRWIYVFEK